MKSEEQKELAYIGEQVSFGKMTINQALDVDANTLFRTPEKEVV